MFSKGKFNMLLICISTFLHVNDSSGHILLGIDIYFENGITVAGTQSVPSQKVNGKAIKINL